MVVAKDAMGAIEGAKEMSDAIRQAAEECGRECGISGITERIGELADIIERAMRKLLAERVKEAERKVQVTEAKVWQRATEMIAHGNDIRTWAKARIAELEAKP